MKNLKKKVRDAQYYCFVIDKWYDNIPKQRNVLKKSDILRILTEANIYFGMEDNKNTSFTVLRKLEDMLGQYIEKVKGNRFSESLYSFKNVEEKTISEMKKKVLSYFDLRYKDKEEKNSKKSSCPIKKERKNYVKKATLEHLYKTLNWMVENKENSIERKKLLEILNFKNIQSSQVESWIKTIENYNGTIVDLIYIATNGRKTNKGFIKSSNPGDGLISIIKIGNELYNMFPNNKFNNKPVYVKKDLHTATNEFGELSKHDFSNLLYAVAGIIVGNDYRSIEINDICSNLDRKFGIKSTKREIVSTLKDIPEFDLIEHGERIRLASKESWEKIVKEHGPKNFKKEVLVRLSFDLKTLRLYFPESKVISEISDSDAIYKVIYDETVTSLINWIELYRKFRGTDKILNDEELEQTICREIERINALAFSESLRYKLEI